MKMLSKSIEKYKKVQKKYKKSIEYLSKSIETQVLREGRGQKVQDSDHP